jgi:hypothetical protein
MLEREKDCFANGLGFNLFFFVFVQNHVSCLAQRAADSPTLWTSST